MPLTLNYVVEVLSMTYTFDVIRDLGEIGNKGKSLKIIKWGDNQPKFDFRTWRKDEGGNLLPGKGITFTKEEGRELAQLLAGYL